MATDPMPHLVCTSWCIRSSVVVRRPRTESALHGNRAERVSGANREPNRSPSSWTHIEIDRETAHRQSSRRVRSDCPRRWLRPTCAAATSDCALCLGAASNGRGPSSKTGLARPARPTELGRSPRPLLHWGPNDPLSTFSLGFPYLRTLTRPTTPGSGCPAALGLLRGCSGEGKSKIFANLPAALWRAKRPRRRCWC